MGYRIKYQITGEMKKMNIHAGKIRFVFLGIFAATILSYTIWANRGEWLTALHALESMADELEQGSDVKAAFTSFCLQVLHGG